MTNKLIGVALFAILLALAPLAAAEADSGNTTEGSSERPDDAAWVEDCPPDKMCAASSSDEPKENVTRGEDCEYCRDHQDSDCVDCLGAPGSQDNTTWGTDCPPGVYCMVNGDPEDPDDAGWVDCDGEICAYDTPSTEDESAAEASGFGAYAFLGALALVGLAFTAAFRRD